MTPKTSEDLPGPAPKKDAEREQQNAVIEDAGRDEARHRSEEHGDGSTIGLDKE